MKYIRFGLAGTVSPVQLTVHVLNETGGLILNESYPNATVPYVSNFYAAPKLQIEAVCPGPADFKLITYSYEDGILVSERAQQFSAVLVPKWNIYIGQAQMTWQPPAAVPGAPSDEGPLGQWKTPLIIAGVAVLALILMKSWKE